MPCDSVFDFWKAMTLFLAAATVAVGVQQYEVSRNKLKLDLFEKRFVVFSALRKFLSGVFSRGAVDKEELETYRIAILEARFLFEQYTDDYLWEIHNKAQDLSAKDIRMKSLPMGPDKDKLVDTWGQEYSWLTNQLKEIGAHFSPYMAFGKWRDV